MGSIGKLYGTSLALLSDLYELTMAYGYWKEGMGSRQAVFNAFFRECPFGGGYAIACGLENVVEYLEGLAFTDADLEYLARQTGNDDRPLFDEGFLEALRTLRFACDVDAVPEGTLVFPNEPMVRVRGPLMQAQFLETTLLTLMNFETLIATKASRVVRAAGGDAVLEFGLRRAQGPDGGVSEARAALVGGCHSTSNVLAGKLFDVPLSGTHAHSWVMAHDSEREAFEAWARAMPNNAIFLVDTYDTLEGVRRAIRVGRELEERGHRMVGVRLDSGDMAELSIESRRLLDEAGFGDAKVVASGELDEHAIEDLRRRGARIDVYGVGTKLATAADDPALGGVYKITAVQGADGRWRDRIKLSEEAVKTSTPGVQQIRRFFRDGRMLGDLLWDERLGIGDAPEGRAIDDPARTVDVSEADASEDLLVPVFREGRFVGERPPVAEIAARAARHLEGLPERHQAFRDAPAYPGGLETGLAEVRERLRRELGGGEPSP
ncbi:MAG: nicotinate phosphoribosyltransferase [Myxococcota bacterium]|nr:nicotinate phosphoribosyltransferase [Myxococcota bacterium]